MSDNYSTNRKPSDDDLADRYCRQYPHTAFGLGSFYRYKGGFWSVLSSAQVNKEILSIIINAKSEGIRPTKNQFSSVYELIKIKTAVEDERWDANANLLAVANGTLELHTMHLVDSSPENYLTYALPFNFDPTAKAPYWERFLSRLPEDVVELLQEFVGLALTTEMKYEMAIWLVGAPGGGKSTFITGVETVAGPLCTYLSLANFERSQFALGNLIGKTVAVSQEQPAGYIKAAYLLNAIISGERIPYERKYQHPIEIYPKMKLIWAMNERPRLPGGENGLFRRIKVVEFPSLPEGERILDLKDKIRREGPGILIWALKGLKRLNMYGQFTIPMSVTAATEEYQLSNDIPAIFIQECFDRVALQMVQASDLYREYVYWCEENGHKPKSSTAVAEDWKRLGLTKRALNGRNYWVGIQKKPDYRCSVVVM